MAPELSRGNARTPYLAWIALLGLIGLAAPATAQSPCDSLPILAKYETIDAVDHTDAEHVVLTLYANSHEASCGGPDCYGTQIFLRLTLEEKQGLCVVRRAEIATKEFATEGCLGYQPADQYGMRPLEFAVEELDLADPMLERLTLRRDADARALLILPHTFFYFESVVPGGVLNTELDDLSHEIDECCWGATMAGFEFYVPNPGSARQD